MTRHEEASSGSAPLPTLEDVRSAARRLAGVANRTPVFTSRTLNRTAQTRIFLKAESFQRAGSFKFRGAYSALSLLSGKERDRGVLTFSSGNHAQALALAGRITGTPITVVMPRNAPAVKAHATAEYGAEIIFYDPEEEAREELGRRICAERGLSLIPPFDHPHIVAGQGTSALELLEDVPALDLLLVPCGGGGLLSGSALAASSTAAIEVIGVEPALADDAARSFRSGTLQRTRNPPTIADGLRTPSLGTITWPIIRERVTDFVTVSETEIVDAMRLLWTRLKLVVEPSGAVALAPLLRSDGRFRDRHVGVILSGGNVDLPSALRLLSEPAGESGASQ